MEDEDKMMREFEAWCDREELIWEVWLRTLVATCMPTVADYHQWLHVRAKRSPEELYGSQSDSDQEP